MDDILIANIQSNTTGVIDDLADIQQSMQALIRKHLKDVLETSDIPPSGEPIELEMCYYLASRTVDYLRRDMNVLAAELMQAALQLSQVLPEDGVDTVNDFLQRGVGLLVREGDTGAKEFGAYLVNILLELSRRQWFGLAQPQSSKSSAESTALRTASEPCVTLYIRDSTIPLLFCDILSSFWGTRLDTNCHSCQQPIIDEPPIRTIAPLDPSSTMPSGAHVRVINRHFSCLRAINTLWIPVSHVWDASIRRANESKTHDDDAASTLLNTLTALLNASVDAYGPNVEFWHDYFSVPQWEERTKESLLLQIPVIFHEAQEILVQMSDISESYVETLVLHGSIGSSASTALRLMPALHALYSSQWMERMWVLLEYSVCRSASIMDKSDYIWRSPDEVNGMSRNTFTHFVNSGNELLLELHSHAKYFSSNLWVGPLAWLTNKDDHEQRNICLGEALGLITRTKCQLFRDRFLAIHMLLDKTSLPGFLAIPLDATQACQWVWRAALGRHDFSPLLLQPRESHRESNPTVEIPSWLTGYSGLDHAEWDLGEQQASSQSIITIQDGLIRIELDIVGEIESILYLDTEDSGEVAGVEWAIEILGSLANKGAETRNLSAEELVEGLNRIFPFDNLYTSHAEEESGVVYTLEGRQSQDKSFRPKLEKYLAEYFAALSASSQRREVAQKLTQLLQYDTCVSGTLAAGITRLSVSNHIARSRRKRGALHGEPICEVRCLGSACQARTVFRLDLRTNAKIGDRVYRIPGLTYSGTTQDGVGIVLNKEGRITGRMLYGSPTCPCQTRQVVEIR